MLPASLLLVKVFAGIKTEVAVFGSCRFKHRSGALNWRLSSPVIFMEMLSDAPAPVNGANRSTKSFVGSIDASSTRLLNRGTGRAAVLATVTAPVPPPAALIV